MKKKIVFILLALCLLVGCGKKKEEKLLMGLVPAIDQDSTLEVMKPMADSLSDKLGMKVETFVANNYVGVVEALGSGEIDFGIIPPFAYALAHKESGAEAILVVLDKNGNPGFYSQILVRSDSGIESLDDLKGKKIAFVDPSSSSGYIFPGAMLIENGIDLEEDIEYIFSGSHDNSLELLLNGDVDGIATYENIVKRYYADFPEEEGKLKVLAVSDRIPGVSVVVKKDFDPELKEELKKALLEAVEEKDAGAPIQKSYNIFGFGQVEEGEYDVIFRTAETMNIDLKGDN